MNPGAQQSAPLKVHENTSLTPFNDMLRNGEAMLLGFLAENSLPFSLAPKPINLSQALATDAEVFEKMSVGRTAASYKLKYGLARTFEESLLEKLGCTTFALNLDEAINANRQTVVTVLVSHFSKSQQRIVVNHLIYVIFIRLTSETLLLLEEILTFLGRTSWLWWWTLADLCQDLKAALKS